MGQLLLEATFVGISTVIMGSIIGYVIGQFVKSSIPKGSENWNKYYVMELSLFFTGFLLHMFYELVGLNARYCANKC